MAPPKPQRTYSDSPNGSTENLSGVVNVTSVSEKKYRAPQPPSYPGDTFKNEKHNSKNGVQVNSTASEKTPRFSLPPPDYEALFPKKRHGVMTNTRWEHIVAEVNQRKMTHQDGGKEMSVDGPDEPMSNKSSVLKEKNAPSLNQHHRDYQVVSSAATKGLESKQALIPPKPANLPMSNPQFDGISEQGRTNERLYSGHEENNKSKIRRNPGPSVQSQQDPRVSVKDTLNPIPDPTLGQISEPKKDKPTPTARNLKKSVLLLNEHIEADTTSLPLAKPREGASSTQPVRQVQPAQSTLTFTPSASSQVERKRDLLENAGHEEAKLFTVNKNVNIPKQQPPANVINAPEKKMIDFDPFPSDELISQDPWALPPHTMDHDDLFTGDLKKGKPEVQRLSLDDFDDIFESVASKNETDAFFVPQNDLKKSHNASPSSQKIDSQKKKLAPQPPGRPIMGKDTMDRPVLQEADDDELTVTSLAEPKGGETMPSTSRAHLDPFTSLSSAVPEMLSGSTPGGKSTLCAWVSPSEVQSGTSQSSGGGGVLTSRR